MLKKLLLFISLVLAYNMQLFAQDTVFNADGQKFTLTDAIVRNHFDYKDILNRIKQDSSFYKAFKTLRTIGYSSYNHIIHGLIHHTSPTYSRLMGCLLFFYLD